MISVKQGRTKHHFWVLGIEPWSPGPLTNTLLITPYDTKQSDGEVRVMQEVWGMRSTPLLPLLPGPLLSGVVGLDRGPSMG